MRIPAYSTPVTLTPFTVVVTLLAVFGGAFIQGTIAFGMGIFIVVTLAWLFPASSLIPFVTLVAWVNLLELGRRRNLRWWSLFSPVILLPTVAGIAIGTLLLVTVPDRGVKLAIGAAVTLTGILFVFRPPQLSDEDLPPDNTPWEPWRYGKALAVFLGALLGAWVSTAGPPLVLYGYATLPPDAAKRFLLRAFMLGILSRFFSYAYYGLWTAEILLLSVVSIPIVLAGTALGHRLSTHLDSARTGQVVWTAFSILGLILLIRTLGAG